MNAKVVKLRRPPYRPRVDVGDISPIVNDIPMPTMKQAQQRYPINALLVGESFSVPKDRAVSLRASVAHYKQKFPKRNYTTRTDGDRVRVWRVK